MTPDQAIAFAVLAGALVLFIWGRWRYDVVALLALLAVVLSDLVPARDGFLGFAHPAVITVAAVLVISRALRNAGIVDFAVQLLTPLRGREVTQLVAQNSSVALLSGFMNNVDAMALMLPVALRNAYREGYAPAKALMPLAFASLLGGLVTLVGTPPNIIIAAFRGEHSGTPFAMFDFAPVGLPVAIIGVAFISIIGWRLIPRERRGQSDPEQLFQIEEYVAEARIDEGSDYAGKSVQELEAQAEYEVTVAGVIRGERRLLIPSGYERLGIGDILILEGDPTALKALIDTASLQLVGGDKPVAQDLRSDEVGVVEAVVNPGSPLIGGSPRSLRLRTIHGINLLAIARYGKPVRRRLREARFQTGDVLLLQGVSAKIADTLQALGCLPLAERGLQIGRPQRLTLATGIFGLAIAATLIGLVPVYIAFMSAVALLVLLEIVSPAEVYDSIEWPVIVLLGAMIPVGAALEATGGAALVADGIVTITAGLAPAWVLLILFVGTMFISDVINNNATAVLMAPIAIGVSEQLGVSADPFLMGTALGASCAFLTPIGHQSNTLVMAPGGYRFGDYWRLGLPVEVLITAVGVPMILLVWPF